MPPDIAFIADDAYTPPLHAALVSLFDSAAAPPRVHVVSTQSDEQAARTRALLSALRADARFVGRRDVAARLAVRPAPSETFRGRPHYVKLLLPELLPDLSRLLYLDSDLIVRRDLAPLWSTDLAGNILAAVEDPSFIGAQHAAFRAWHDGRYFNSGVMLIDLAAWRAAGITERFADWHRFYERGGGAAPWHAFWEQSPLNKAVGGRWLRIPPLWNWWPAFVARTGWEPHGMAPEAFAAFLGLTVAELHACEEDPAVCHFAGPNKPWLPERLTDPSPWFVAYREHAARARRLTDDAIARAARPRPEPLRPPANLAGLMSLLCARLTASRAPVRLLQAGAHDGRTNDPFHMLLRGHRWHGVLIEPVPHLLLAARQAYAGCPGVRFRQAAASAADGRGVLFAVKDVPRPPVPWFSQISSIEIAPFAAHAEHIGDLPDLIEELSVETRTLDSLIAEHDFPPDVVSIAVEGHDAAALSGLDLARWRPAVVRIQIQHLSDEGRASVAFRLKRAGYAAALEGPYAAAFLPELLTGDELRALAGDPGALTFL